jgi:hypothetical protein
MSQGVLAQCQTNRFCLCKKGVPWDKRAYPRAEARFEAVRKVRAEALTYPETKTPIRRTLANG